MAITLRPTRRRSRFVPRLLWFLLILAALYTAAWFGAVAFARSQAGDWLAREAGKGRVWACDEPNFSGFPFSLRLACANPALTLAGDTGANVFAAKTLFAHVDIFSPTEVNLVLGAPVSAKLRNGDTALLNARDVRVVAGLAPGGLDQALQSLAVTTAAPDLAVTAASGRGFSARAASAHLTLAAAPGGHDLVIDADGLKLPALEQLTQSPAPATLHVAGLIEKLDLPGHGGVFDRIERWRAGGGVLTLNKSTLGNGVTQLEVSGPLALDEEHRPAGKLAVRLVGAGPILQRFGVPAAVLNPGGLLGALLGKNKKPEPETESDPAGLRLNVTLQGGKVHAGPVPLPVELKALY